MVSAPVGNRDDPELVPVADRRGFGDEPVFPDDHDPDRVEPEREEDFLDRPRAAGAFPHRFVGHDDAHMSGEDRGCRGINGTAGAQKDVRFYDCRKKV